MCQVKEKRISQKIQMFVEPVAQHSWVYKIVDLGLLSKKKKNKQAPSNINPTELRRPEVNNAIKLFHWKTYPHIVSIQMSIFKLLSQRAKHFRIPLRQLTNKSIREYRIKLCFVTGNFQQSYVRRDKQKITFKKKIMIDYAGRQTRRGELKAEGI